MARTTRQLVPDDNTYVDVTLRMPASLYRTVHSYCMFRELAGDQLPAIATAAIGMYFADNRPFQAWLRRHPDISVALPESPVRLGRKRRSAVSKPREADAR